MQRSDAERHWLSWFSKTGKIVMGWSCFLNSATYPTIERTFEGIAQTRKKLLITWAQGRWDILSLIAKQLVNGFPNITNSLLNTYRAEMPDCSELFIIDQQGKVLSSSFSQHIGRQDLLPRAVAAGLKAQFLHGPYIDPLTLTIGPSNSQFHDEVTLMFYQPITKDNTAIGCLCARIPNDVMSDLIQREAGHVFPDSGDNYIFMGKSNFDPSIPPGMALSRSRFEDDAFTLGDNLRSGVRTAYGMVSIKKHTELELLFNDPATNQLHPGVRETLAQGENLFVTYPGYADYRHIPVIGKGVTFTLPGSQDLWGMMCEGDLEEAYRRRSLTYCTTKAGLFIGLLLLLVFAGINYWIKLSALAEGGLAVILFLIGGIGIVQITLKPLSRRLDKLSNFFLDVAERSGSLKDRLSQENSKNDESGQLAQWINSFIDKTDETVDSVLKVAQQTAQVTNILFKNALALEATSIDQSNATVTTTARVEKITSSIINIADHASVAERITRNAKDSSSAGQQLVKEATEEIEHVSSTITESAALIQRLGERSREISKIIDVIRGIADQTNLLALNAAIEAARADEQGRGFAVVADQVRSLAELTAKSTSEIGDMIGAIQGEIQSAVTTMGNCSEEASKSVTLTHDIDRALEEISSGSSQSLQVVQDIAHGTHDQRVASEEVMNNMEAIAKMVQLNAERVKETKESAITLDLSAHRLQSAASKFNP